METLNKTKPHQLMTAFPKALPLGAYQQRGQ